MPPRDEMRGIGGQARAIRDKTDMILGMFEGFFDLSYATATRYSNCELRIRSDFSFMIVFPFPILIRDLTCLHRAPSQNRNLSRSAYSLPSKILVPILPSNGANLNRVIISPLTPLDLPAGLQCKKRSYPHKLPKSRADINTSRNRRPCPFLVR